MISLHLNYEYCYMLVLMRCEVVELLIVYFKLFLPVQQGEMADRSTVSSQALRKLEEQLTCPICLEQFTNPKILPCFHSFCLHCLEGVAPELVEGNLCLPCPTCRSPCPNPDKGLASLPPSFVINNLSEVYGLMKKVSGDQQASCDNCDKTNANRYCKQCSMFFCPECLHHHDNFKPHAGHQTLSLEEVANTAYQLPLAKTEATISCTHHNKPLERFCESCEELICDDCTVKKHKDHDYDVVNDTYKKHQDILEKLSLQQLSQQCEQLTQDMTNLINRKKEITQQGETTKENIHDTIDQLKRLLDETEIKLIGEVDVAVQHKVIVLDYQIKEVETALGQVRECRDHVEQSLKIGSPQQVLSTKSQMMSRTDSVISCVKNKRFQPLEPANVELVKSDKINEIHKNIGKVKNTSTLNRLLSSKVSASLCPFSFTGQKSTITISFNGSPVLVRPSLISCSLTPPDNSQPIQCLVKESRMSRQYNVVFTPVTRGLHQLHVRVFDIEIPGSPMSIPVSIPPKKRSTPVKIISGLREPSGVAVTDDGLVIVSERGASCITILDKEGNKINSVGSLGTERGQLVCPEGVAVSSKGTILVADCCNYRIQEFTMEGECISCVGTKGKGPLQFCYPKGIAVNKTTGQVVVAEDSNNCVQVLNSDLTFSHMFFSRGLGQREFKGPTDVAVDNEGFVYVADCGNHCIQKFTPEGQFVCSFGTKGSQPGQLYHPAGVTVDDHEFVYVNCYNDYVSVFTTDGQYHCRIQKNLGAKKSHVLSLPPVLGVTIDRNGYLYICCDLDGQIKVF